MISIFRYGNILAVFVFGLWFQPISAQVINLKESAAFHKQVGFWQVYSISDSEGVFACRATRNAGYDNQIMISYAEQGERLDQVNSSWSIIVQARRQDSEIPDATRSLQASYDATRFNGQAIFGENENFIFIPINNNEVARFMAGNLLSLTISEEASRDWQLTDSANAVLAIIDCAAAFDMDVTDAANRDNDSFLVAQATVRTDESFDNARQARTSQARSTRRRPEAGLAGSLPSDINGYTVGLVRFPQGLLGSIGQGYWAAEVSNQIVSTYRVFDNDMSLVYLTERGRNVQLKIDLLARTIYWTQNFDNNWKPVYVVECFGKLASRTC